MPGPLNACCYRLIEDGRFDERTFQPVGGENGKISQIDGAVFVNVTVDHASGMDAADADVGQASVGPVLVLGM